MTTTTPRPPGVYFDMARAEYDADPGLNQSSLKEFYFSKSPRHYKWNKDHPKESDDQKKCLRLGHAIDCLVEDPSQFKNRFMIWEGERRQGNEWKALKTSAEAQGKVILNIEEREQVRGMVEGIFRNKDANRIIETSHRQVAIIANHPTLKFRMKALIDIFPDMETEWLFDMKTTGVGADPQSFHEHVYNMGYDWQAAWYTDIARFAGLTAINGFGFIAVESEAPHECLIHYIGTGDAIMQQARNKCYEAAVHLNTCIESGVWETYPQAWFKVHFSKPWMMKPEQRSFDVYERL